LFRSASEIRSQPTAVGDTNPAGVRFLRVDGVTAGLWERKKGPKRIEFTVAPVRRFRRPDLEREVERYGTFLGLEPVLRVG
jgi:hypothetical protein